MKTLEEIWSGDLFNRQEEAEQLIGYLEAVAMRPSLREDGHAYVLAVDAPYGEGKSFFLRRFADHMARSHPVAFVDAWVDDLEDEPLVALAATLDAALSPYADKSAELRQRINDFKTKAGAVTRIVATGLLKRAASLLIMESGAEAIGDVVGKTSELRSDLGKDVLKDAANELVDNVSSNAATIVSGSMESRIARFREGRDAVSAMKAALKAIVEYLGTDEVYPAPIVIVIDELDRCRPTYAIKLLEEVKHLFDVEGVVFVLGMHGEALAHSVSAAYGANFDGSAYLLRFITRRYTLRSIDVGPLLSTLITARGFEPRRLVAPPVLFGLGPTERATRPQLATMLSMYLAAYGMNARSAFAVIDVLETCLALTGNTNLYLAYLMPLVCNFVRGRQGFALADRPVFWKYSLYNNLNQVAYTKGINELASEFADAVTRTSAEISQAYQGSPSGSALAIVGEFEFGNAPAEFLGNPKNYERLLRVVSRFE